MLRLIWGGFGSGKSERVSNLIAESVSNADIYKKSIYLIVPEQDTVRAELDTTKKLPPSSALSFEVQNFSRLANTVFRELGGLCYNYADAQSKALCMWRSIRALGGLLFEPSEGVDESRVSSLLGVMGELRSAGIGVRDVEIAAKKLGDTPLGHEMTDLSLIMAMYSSVLSENYSDSEADLDRLCDMLETNRFFSGCSIFIDGFSSYTYPQLRLIRVLMRDAECVTVTIPYDRARGRFTYGEEAQGTASTLMRYAEELGCVCEHEELCENYRAAYEDIKYVAQSFCLEGAEPYEGVAEHVSVLECSDLREEAEAVSCLVKKKVYEGAAYRDIAVVARNAQDYAGILDASFERHGIPCFFSCELRPESHPIVKLIYGALSIYAKKCRREDVISYLKTGLCGVSAEDADVFEQYTKTWKISGMRLISKEPFLSNPDGYTDKLNKRAIEVLSCANKVRETLRGELEPLFSALDRDTTIADICSSLWKYLSDIGADKKLRDEALSHEARGDEQAARECEGIYSCLVSTIDTLVLCAGDERVDVGEFLKLLKMSLRTKTVSVIPTSADAVTVGSAHMLRASGISHVILIGASDRSFPAPVLDRGYFDAVKRRKLSELGINIENDVVTEVSKELFYYARATCSASDSISVLYSTSAGSGESVRRSGATSQLCELLGVNVRKFSSLDISERVYDEASLYEMALSIGEDSRIEGARALFELAGEGALGEYKLSRVLSKEIIDKLWSQKLSMTQARLEKYAKCHFSYLCSYVLGLSEEKSYDFSASDIGNFVHDVLDKLTGELSVGGVFYADIPKEELDSRIERIAADYLSRILPENDARSARLLNLMRRIRRSVSLICENICSEFCTSHFSPIAHELKIAEDSPTNPAPLRFTLEDGRMLSLYGTLDRADAYKKDGDVYIRVIDYKTGTKDFSLDDIEKGLNLQLLIYLFTLCRDDREMFKRALGAEADGSVHAAGMLYYSAAVKDISTHSPKEAQGARAEAERELVRRGLLTDDVEILRAMEPELLAKYIPVKQTKTEIKPTKAVTLLSRDGFDELYNSVEKKIVEIGSELCQGRVEVEPLEHNGKLPCSYCSMKHICRYVETDELYTEDDDEGWEG